MTRFSTKTRQSGAVAFIGSYPPRRCGIATFTHDLAEAVAKQGNRNVIAVAMKDGEEGYDFSDRVRCEIHQESQRDYSRAVDFLNSIDVDVVSLQHEYGIYGGEHGSNVLMLFHDLRKPVVVTCHTVKKYENSIKREILGEIAARADRVVVMSKVAVDILEEVYGACRDKIVCIPHGIHDTPYMESSRYKDRFGLGGRKVLLSFGLLDRHKCIEYVIDALPAIIEKNPRLTYVVLGATHPKVLQDEGDDYRRGLEERVAELGLQEHVLFDNRFVELNELLDYLGACDILVTPYDKLDQITSGVLIYAMGRGRAVVSTPYWHAKELLVDGRGRFVPVRDSAALTREINGLFDDPSVLSDVCEKAYAYSRGMTWSAVARDYLHLFSEVRSHSAQIMPVVSSKRRQLIDTSISAFGNEYILPLDEYLPAKRKTATSSPSS